MDTDATDFEAALDNRYTLAQLCRLHGRTLARRSAANAYQVEVKICAQDTCPNFVVTRPLITALAPPLHAKMTAKCVNCDPLKTHKASFLLRCDALFATSDPGNSDQDRAFDKAMEDQGGDPQQRDGDQSGDHHRISKAQIRLK